MVSSVLGTLIGGILALFMLVLGLLPTIDVSTLPIALPEPVSRSLSAINWFIPVDTLLTVLTVWIGLLIVLNAVLLIMHVVQSVTKG